MAITTIYTYPLTGSQREFTVPFEYLARRFVVLTLIGQDRKELVLATDFRFISKTIVQTTVPWGPADGYERIEIRRDTSATDRLVDFADGSILRASELNISQIQTLHVAEEARNMVADTISENADGDLDARGRRLANLADATDPGHAVTLRQEQAWAQSTLGNRNASAASAAAALVSQNASKTSETNSKASEVAAAGSAAAALVSQNASKTSETNSKASEVAAKTSETNSKASEVAAKTSETNSKASEVAAAGYAAGLNMPSAIGGGGMYLRQRLDEAGLEYGETDVEALADAVARVKAFVDRFGPEGTHPLFAARAWCVFNGTLSTGNIRSSAGVESITRVSTGQYKVSLTAAMPDTNYAVVCGGRGNVTGAILVDNSTFLSRTTKSFLLAVTQASGASEDGSWLSFAVYR